MIHTIITVNTNGRNKNIIRSGSKYVIGREGWKTMIVSKLMYGCGALHGTNVNVTI